jgi:thiol-disulfide isomerase/thioredoxin
MVKIKTIIILSLLLLFNSRAILATPPIFVDNAEDAFMLSADTHTDLLLIFGASWCAPCKSMKQDISDNLDIVNDMIVCYVDIDKRDDLKKEYRVKVIPDYMIYRDNTEIKRRVSYNGKNDLLQFLHKQ